MRYLDATVIHVGDLYIKTDPIVFCVSYCQCLIVRVYHAVSVYQRREVFQLGVNSRGLFFTGQLLVIALVRRSSATGAL